MKIKSKLVSGVGLLFILIVLLAVVGTMYIHVLTNDTNNILSDNYNTLEYTRNILIAIDENNERSVNMFAENLERQKKNITETGEQELTGRLVTHFEKYVQHPADTSIHLSIRKDIYQLMKLNMQAIERKSNIAVETARTATLWIAVTGTLCFLIAFMLLVNFPGAIANPIRELTQSIKEIANKNYSERLHFKSSDEFGELADAFNTMASKLEEYDNSSLAKLLIEKKRIEMLINKLHHPIVGLDDKKNILFINGQALNILGLPPDRIIGRSASEIAKTNDLMRSLLPDLTKEQENKGPLKIYADNKESYFEKDIIPISITPTGEKQSREIGHVIILQNITPFKELDSAKTNFIATVSHELKTPISSIKMSLHLLEDERIGASNEEQKKLITSIKEDSDRLLKITGELLNLSQVETGNIQLSIQASDPRQIVQYALEAVKVQAEQKHVALIAEFDNDLPAVKADMEKTAWVLINLLTNAIRYSPGNSNVIIEIVKIRDELVFSVKDHGKGIDSKYTQKIFERYFQVPGSSRSGTGLGLAISKEFIEAQEGEIGLESNIGEGSRFYFKLKTC